VDRSGGLAGRAYWLAGQSGTGKTTLARLIGAEVADPVNVVELDAASLTVSDLLDIERELQVYGLGVKPGRAYLVNEAHALRKPVIRQLLVMLERIPRHVAIVFTTTTEGQESLLEDYDDASPLLSRCGSGGFGRPAAGALCEAGSVVPEQSPGDASDHRRRRDAGAT
jgi:replication-associated recombination protein RarA